MNLVRLRAEIKKSGLKHKALAEQLSMHPTTFSRALAGKTCFDVDQITILLDVLNLKFEALMKKAS